MKTRVTLLLASNSSAALAARRLASASRTTHCTYASLLFFQLRLHRHLIAAVLLMMLEGYCRRHRHVNPARSLSPSDKRCSSLDSRANELGLCHATRLKTTAKPAGTSAACSGTSSPSSCQPQLMTLGAVAATETTTAASR